MEIHQNKLPVVVDPFISRPVSFFFFCLFTPPIDEQSLDAIDQWFLDTKFGRWLQSWHERPATMPPPTSNDTPKA
jgi:hypothetical protein